MQRLCMIVCILVEFKIARKNIFNKHYTIQNDCNELKQKVHAVIWILRSYSKRVTLLLLVERRAILAHSIYTHTYVLYAYITQR